MASARLRATLLHVAGAALTLAVTASPADAAPKRKVIDGIVAVVDDACITRIELARFIVPFELKVQRELAGKPAEQAKAMQRVRKESVDALVDRTLFGREAARLRIEVTPDEIDRALASVAEQNHLTVPEILEAAKEQGLDPARYRAELRDQITEAKVLQNDATRRFPDWKDLKPEARSERIEKGRQALLEELRARTFIEIRL